MRKYSVLSLLASCVLLGVSTAATHGDWPSFRNGGSSTASNQLPMDWTPELGVVWQQETKGYGQSAPIVWQERVYVTSVEGPMKETCTLSCYKIHDGSLV